MAQYWTDHSLAFALQADLTTTSTLADAAFVPLLCDAPKVTFSTEVTELDLATGQVGAAGERIVGRRSGSVSFVVPLQGLKSGYAPAAEQPGGAPVGTVEVLPPWFLLLANAVGCNVEALAGATLADKNTNFWRGTFLQSAPYAAGAVVAAGTDATHLVLDGGETANYVAGGFLSAATSAAVAPFLGFIKTKVEATETSTLFEATRAPAANYDDDNANVYGTGTAWQSDDQPVYFTARWSGPDTTFAYIFSGLVCESWKLSLDAGPTPQVEFTFRFYDYSMDKTRGGLVVPDAFVRTPQLVGSKSGVAMLDGAVKCGLDGVSVEWKATLRESKCHYASQGIAAVAIIKPRWSVSFSVPHDRDDFVYSDAGVAGNTGSHVWQSSLELGTTHSLGIYVGPAIGRCLGVLVPGAFVTSVPSIGDRDGAQAYTLTLEATAYSGDTTDGGETSATTPINSVGRVALS